MLKKNDLQTNLIDNIEHPSNKGASTISPGGKFTLSVETKEEVTSKTSNVIHKR
jgi:hypothetical protein